MRAIGYRFSLPVEDPACLVEEVLPEPTPGPRDLLVDVSAVSVNPVDTKVRRGNRPAAGEFRVLGWDAVGRVVTTGSGVSLFRPGDRVYYAGDLTRPGANSQLHVVDERVAGPAPGSLTDAEAAALPLTSITAWELLFDRLGAQRSAQPSGQSILIVGAAGGVGSILTQIAHRLTGLTVIGTASRPESQKWVRRMGADHVVDHTEPLPEQIAALSVGPVRYVASLTHTDQHFPQLAEILAPQGRLALIDDPVEPPDIRLLKRKSASIHWEFMFTRSMFGTADLATQHALLAEVAGLVDAGLLRSTIGRNLGAICAANLRQAHSVLERHEAIGKIVLAGW